MHSVNNVSTNMYTTIIMIIIVIMIIMITTIQLLLLLLLIIIIIIMILTSTNTLLHAASPQGGPRGPRMGFTYTHFAGHGWVMRAIINESYD